MVEEVARRNETVNSVNNIGDGGDLEKLWVTLMELLFTVMMMVIK